MSEGAACANCGAPFRPERRRFCPECGQETHVKPPTLGEFAQQFGGAYLSTEGAIWRTLGLLLFKPGELTRRYLAGRRKHYVLPLRLYLTISVLVLLAMRMLAGGNMEQGVKFDIDTRKGEFAVISFGDGMVAGMKDGQFYCRGYPAWVCKRLQRRIDVDPAGMKAQAEELSQRAIGNVGAAMFFVLPVFAAALKLLYPNRRMRYTEHLVFALHLHAFWFAMLGLMLVPLGLVSGGAALAMPVYAVLALRRVYAERWWSLLPRVFALAMLYLVVMVLAVVGVAIAAVLA